MQVKNSSPHLELLVFRYKALIYDNILNALRVTFQLTSE